MTTPFDAYQHVTDRILEALEQGRIPWSKPWTPAAGEHVSIDGRAYTGINPFLLSLTAQAKAYASPVWLTFKSAKRHGGTVRRGERGTKIVFWRILRRTDQAEDGQEEVRSIPLLRVYTVFNLEQTEGVTVPPALAARLEAANSAEPFDAIEAAEAILRGYLSGDNAPGFAESPAAEGCYYAPRTDSIVMVDRQRFAAPEAFYGTAFHECAHSTGHGSRLARKGVTDLTAFGSHAYSQEELVAEMTSAFLACAAGMDSEGLFENSVAYLQSWLRVLRADSKMVVVAAAQAQKAADRIRGIDRSATRREEDAGDEASHAMAAAAA